MAEDQLGEIFSHDIRALGVHYQTKPEGTFPPTARSMIFVTPDGERSMNTFLGACVDLGPEHVEEEVVAQAKVTYFEGYCGIRRAPRKPFARAPASPMPTVVKFP